MNFESLTVRRLGSLPARREKISSSDYPDILELVIYEKLVANQKRNPKMTTIKFLLKSLVTIGNYKQQMFRYTAEL